MLAINEIEFENMSIESPMALAALRATGKLPFDQMPLLEIDRQNLSQSNAMVRFLARRGDFYGDNNEDALWCDMVAGAAADFAEAGLQAAFQPSKEIAISVQEERFGKFGPRFEARLAENGSGFCAGTRLTFADVVLVEALSAYLEWVPDVLKDTPLLANLCERVVGTPGITRYLQSPQRYPMASNDYVIHVASVLQRALPLHMPNPNRFVSIEGKP
jgi:glutathione S-transferase